MLISRNIHLKKQLGFYQNKVNSSLTFIHRPSNQAHNCKMSVTPSEICIIPYIMQKFHKMFVWKPLTLNPRVNGDLDLNFVLQERFWERVRFNHCFHQCVGRHSTDSQPTIGPLLVQCWSTVGPLSVHCWSTIGPLSFLWWSTVGRLSADASVISNIDNVLASALVDALVGSDLLL